MGLSEKKYNAGGGMELVNNFKYFYTSNQRKNEVGSTACCSSKRTTAKIILLIEFDTGMQQQVDYYSSRSIKDKARIGDDWLKDEFTIQLK